MFGVLCRNSRPHAAHGNTKGFEKFLYSRTGGRPGHVFEQNRCVPVFGT
jgi:hypothetical protein